MVFEQHTDFPNLHVMNHPLVAHKLALLRDKNTHKKIFKELVQELTLFLGMAATQALPTETIQVTTPIETTPALQLQGKKPVILPILRAGLGMVEGLLTLMPSAKVGHLGLARNEKTLEPMTYFFKIPHHSEQRAFFICDPMIATGGSLIQAVNLLKEKGITNITVVCLIAAPEGVRKFSSVHPEIHIFTASLDRGLNKDAYIVPGLGDAGDRLFGTLDV